jgi:hypothetical protein
LIEGETCNLLGDYHGGGMQVMAGRNQAELVFQKHTFACFGIFDLQSRNSHLSSTFRRHSNDIQQII